MIERYLLWIGAWLAATVFVGGLFALTLLAVVAAWLW